MRGTYIALVAVWCSIWAKSGRVRWMNMQTNRHDEGDVNELAHTTRRVFCTDLLLSSAGLLLAATAATKDVAAQDSTVAYPARKIEGAEALLPGSSLYFNYPTRNDPAVRLRFSESEYRAYSRRCSHAGCSVEFHFPESMSYVSVPSWCIRCSHWPRDVWPARASLGEIVLQVRAGGHLWAVAKNTRNTEIITQNLRGGD